MLHCKDKTKKCIQIYINLLHYNRCKPPKCVGHLLWPSSGRWFFEGYITQTTKPMYNNKIYILNIPCVVTSEKNSLSAAHAGHKRWRNWNPVPGCIAGPPCPGGYKYGRLDLQVGGWATGWQLVIMKNLLGNINCGIGRVRLSGIDLSSGKGLIRTATFAHCTVQEQWMNWWKGWLNIKQIYVLWKKLDGQWNELW
jgi:hypothetical protein